MSVRVLSQSDGPAETLSADVCVIGAGMAGLVAARRLAQAGRSIIVLESGGAGDNTAKPSPLNKIDDVNGNYPGAVSGRYRGLGGTSQIWGGRLLPLTRSDMGHRDYLSLPPWPFDVAELDPYLKEVEQLFQVDSTPYDEVVLDAFHTRGPLPHGDADFAIRIPKWVAFSRCNLGRLLRAEVEQTVNLRVWLDATAVGFELDPVTGRLAAVTARGSDGRRAVVRAAEYLVAAGAIESTRLLLLMDLASGNRAFASCSALGRHFQEHLGARVANLAPLTRGANEGFGYRFIKGTRRSIHLELTAAAQRGAGVASGFCHEIMSAAENSSTDILRRGLRGLQKGKLQVGAPDLVYLARDSANLARGALWRFGRRARLHYWPRDMRHTMNIWIEQLPHPDNHVTLSDQVDEYGVPLARVQWRPTDRDERTFQACVDHLRSYWQRHGLDRHAKLEWVPVIADRSAPIISVAFDLLHPSGSTRMGTDPAESVVDADLRCHHVPNVSVASASTFPTAGSANPTLTILQLALRAADAIAGRLRREVAGVPVRATTAQLG
jgi:choline dehydrogenase-like flavoprotein